MSDLVVTVPVWLLATLKYGLPVVVVLLVFWWEARSNGGRHLAVPAFTIAALFLAVGYYLGLIIG